MKNSKSRNEVNRQRYDDYEEFNKTKKKPQPKRRPVKNWTKAWIEHEDQVDELDEFYGK
jgi:hypothetical protein